MTFFNTIKQKYLIKKTQHLAPLGQMTKESFGASKNELEWLRTKITQAGGTPSGKVSDLWKQLNGLLGYAVSNYINENKKIYFQKNS